MSSVMKMMKDVLREPTGRGEKVLTVSEGCRDGCVLGLVDTGDREGYGVGLDEGELTMGIALG